MITKKENKLICECTNFVCEKGISCENTVFRHKHDEGIDYAEIIHKSLVQVMKDCPVYQERIKTALRSENRSQKIDEGHQFGI